MYSQDKKQLWYNYLRISMFSIIAEEIYPNVASISLVILTLSSMELCNAG